MLTKKTNKLVNFLSQVTDFTFKVLDYLLEVTENMGAEIEFNKAYDSPDIMK
ncbi:hypothetical protein [Rummeliibacillus sp. TYF-LIM-RU47]|uniref:hypothetical protein n=1 Tax=Rummeliibacillus sp. TYF-LIM-RU47 TaxID=2608406 RepID=UPI0016807E34|nr:hypothetical protein [Rummeliibacillus sp. TYF-LIM-RU47]